MRYVDSNSPGLDVLVEMLGRTAKPVAFMVGSALSLPSSKGSPGVPAVSGMIELVKAEAVELGLDANELQRRLGNAESAESYAIAMRFLQDRVSQDAVNRIISQAVRQARTKSNPVERLSDAELEHDLDGWVLSPATRALAELVVRFPETYPGPILTTNFDPLLSIAIERAGGIPHNTVLDADGRLPREEIESVHQRDVIYLHGYWRGGDTLHTPQQLTVNRPLLRASLQRLLRRRLVVVVGYGGWDDAFTDALNSAMFELSEPADVAWVFYEQDPGQIEYRYSKLFESVSTPISRGRFRSYTGVDCNVLFEQLLAHEVSKIGSTAAHEPVTTVTSKAGSRSKVASRTASDHKPDEKVVTRRPRAKSSSPTSSVEPTSSMESKQLAELLEALGQVHALLEREARVLDRKYRFVRGLIGDAYLAIKNIVFAPTSPLSRETSALDRLRNEYESLDDSFEVYEFVRKSIAREDSKENMDALVSQRRKCIRAIDGFYSSFAVITQEYLLMAKSPWPGL